MLSFSYIWEFLIDRYLTSTFFTHQCHLFWSGHDPFTKFLRMGLIASHWTMTAYYYWIVFVAGFRLLGDPLREAQLEEMEEFELRRTVGAKVWDLEPSHPGLRILGFRLAIDNALSKANYRSRFAISSYCAAVLRRRPRPSFFNAAGWPTLLGRVPAVTEPELGLEWWRITPAPWPVRIFHWTTWVGLISYGTAGYFFGDVALDLPANAATWLFGQVAGFMLHIHWLPAYLNCRGVSFQLFSFYVWHLFS